MPPVEAIEPSTIQIPLAAGVVDDDAETIKDISLDSDEGDSPPPTDIMIDEDAAAEAAAASGEETAQVPSGVATPMSLDESDSDVPSAPGAMQLRGGATVEDVAEDAEDDEAEEDPAGEGDRDGEDDSDYDDEEIDEDEVELGLLRPMPAKREEWDIDYAIGKVGGLPRWLDPRSPLGPEDVQCGTCGKTMPLLLQVNSPDDERPHAAARSLYVFACRTAGCLAKDTQQAVRVWRTQMESPNAFYPHTEETQAERKRLGQFVFSATSSILESVGFRTLTRQVARTQRTYLIRRRLFLVLLPHRHNRGPSTTLLRNPNPTRSRTCLVS